MNIELLTVGTELLLGFTIDTNGAEIGRLLAAHGVRVVRRTSVADDGPAIREATDSALMRTGAVLITGGLGPTRDDVTKHATSDLMQMPLAFDEGIWASLEERFRKLGRSTPPSNRSQAMVPTGATVLPNRWGTAPGLWLENERGIVVMLPGVPIEMRNLLRHEVLPRLVARAGGRITLSRTIRTTSIAESALAERLGNIEERIAPVTLAYLPGLDGVDLRLTAWQADPDEAARLLGDAVAAVKPLGGEHVYGEDDETLQEILVGRLRHTGDTVAVAESCTGGLLGARITDVPGSSTVFLGGVIAYANEVKVRDLGVDETVLARDGAVSETVAAAMATGVRGRFGSTWGVAITGIAGPDGGSPEKPVGTVWFGLAGPAGVKTHRAIYPGSRPEIRARGAQAAMFLLLRSLGSRV